MKYAKARLVFIFLFFLTGSIAAAAEGGSWSVGAARVGTPPVIDGVMEEVWFQEEPARLERQFRPALGAAAVADTEVYVLYDDDALYFGWVCHEDDLAGLVACATVRDMFMNNDDCVDVMLDANNDLQSAYDFMVNWRGVKYDGTFAQDSEVGGPAWNGYWEAATSVGEGAWYCEIAVPWVTLRYDRGAGSMGVQFLRFRRPTYEETFWASDGGLLNRVSTFGRIEGLEDLPRPRPFKFTPYATGRGEERFTTPYYGYEPTDAWELKPRYGLDFDYRAGAAASVKATVLPDYAYIEADPAQITIEPTEIWLEEKRPFFTEGFEFFDNYFLYTRRFTEIGGGAKVTGRAGRFNYGALDIKLMKDDPRFPGDNFALVRTSFDAPGGSTFGVTGMGRREFGAEVSPEANYYGEDRARYNNVARVDGRLVLPARLAIRTEGYKSQTAGEGGDGYDYFVNFGRSGITDNWAVWYYEVSEDFRADMSFLQPVSLNSRGAGSYGLRELQVNRGGVRWLRGQFSYEHEWNLDNETKYNKVSPALVLAFENDFFCSVEYRGGRDVSYVPYGYPDYHNDVVEFGAGHSAAAWGSAHVSYWRGTWYGGYYHYYQGEFTFIPTPPLVLNADVDVGDPRAGDRFVVGNLKATHNLTERLFWRFILQGNSAERTSTGSVLWGWDFRPGSTAYLAYEQRRDSSGHFLLAEQLAFLKVSYMISL
jgi:hypothetical protein